MASVYYWEVWCETEEVWVTVWDTDEPTVCPNNNGHTITGSQTRQVSQISTNPDLYPKGSGVRFRSKCFTDFTTPFAFEFEVDAGKKLVMHESKCNFHEDIVGLPHIVFSIQRKIDLGAGPVYCIIYQAYYETLADLVVDGDRKSVNDSVWTVVFDWPKPDNPTREPQILLPTDRVRVYLTDDAIHTGVGTDPTNLYSTVYGFKKYNTYAAAAAAPTWPAPAPKVPLAHVCFDCISYSEGEI